MNRVLSRAIGILGLSVLFAMTGCDHVTDPPDGPNLIDRFGPFEVVADLESDRDEVDFSVGQVVTFTAQFNKNIDWVITITGQSSGAVKRIEGFDRFVDEENAVWNGSTTDLPFFSAEMCEVILSVPEEEYTDTVMVNVLGARIYPGVLAADFEENPGACIILGDFEFELTPASGRQEDIPAGQGSFFYRLEGTDNESGGPTDNFFVGLAEVLPCLNGVTYYDVPTTIPENLFLNFMLRGRNSAYTRAIIGVAIDSNDSGDWNDGVDQVYEIVIDPLYEGWRLQSANMGELGIPQEDLSKIVNIRLVLISLNNLQPSPREQVGFEVDFFTFTDGAPLEL